MSNQLATVNGTLPAPPARSLQQSSINKGFTSGIRESFPTISFKGSKWAVKFQGQLNPININTPQGVFPSPFYDVVLVKASEALSKLYYERAFTEGDINPPDCFSVNGVRPDPASPKLQSPVCATCRQNVFGSKINPAGKPVKACQDSRRVAVAMPTDLLAGQVGPIMLRVPYSSLKPLKEYVQNLERAGYVDAGSCVTRMTFDQQAAFPLLQFAFNRPLTDAEFDAVMDMREGDDVLTRILEMPVDEAMSEGLDPSMQGAINTQAGQGYAQPQYAPPPQQPQYPYQQPQPGVYSAPMGAPQQQQVYQQPAPSQFAPQPQANQFSPPPQQPVYSQSNPVPQAAPQANQFSPPPQQIEIPPGAPQPTPSPRTRQRRSAAVEQAASQAQPAANGDAAPAAFNPANFPPPQGGQQMPPANAFAAPQPQMQQPAQQAAPQTQQQVAQAPPELEAVLAGILKPQQ